MYGKYILLFGLVAALLSFFGFSNIRQSKYRNYYISFFFLIIILSLWVFDTDPIHMAVRWLRDGRVEQSPMLTQPSKAESEEPRSSHPQTNSAKTQQTQIERAPDYRYINKTKPQQLPSEDSHLSAENEKSNRTITGFWVGQANQPNSSSHKKYGVELRIFQASENVRFETKYPELRCNGQGTLTYASESIYRFSETIVSGRSRCVDGYFEIVWLGQESVFWNWENGTATATLSKK